MPPPTVTTPPSPPSPIVPPVEVPAVPRKWNPPTSQELPVTCKIPIVPMVPAVPGCSTITEALPNDLPAPRPKRWTLSLFKTIPAGVPDATQGELLSLGQTTMKSFLPLLILEESIAFWIVSYKNDLPPTDSLTVV